MMKARSSRIALLLALSVLIEIFVFNARSFELIGCHSPQQSLEIAAAETSQDADELSFVIEGKSDIPADLRTLRLDFSDTPNQIVTGTVYTQEKDFRWGHTKTLEIVPGVEHSQNVFIYQGYRVESVMFTLKGVEPQDIKITFNQPVALRIDLLRLLLIFILLGLLWLFRPSSPLYQQKLDLSLPSQKLALAGLFVLFVFVLTFTTLSTYEDPGAALAQGNQLDDREWRNKDHYDLLTDALESGSFSLLLEPPAELAELQNPYDKQERDKNVPDAKWDVVYYEGKYYTYFGITPVLTLLLPYKLISGEHLVLDLAVLLYSIFGTLGLIYCYTWFIKRWFRQTPFPLYLLGALMLFVGCGILWIARRPLVYETALSCAFCFALCGLALNMSAMKKVSKVKLFFGCLLMALAVGARPTAFFVTLLNIPVVLIPLLEQRKENGRKILPDLILCALPYLCVAGFLFYYNYARFGSIGEFGRNYQFSYIDAKIYDNGLTLPSYLLGIVNFIIGSGFQLTSSFPYVAAGDSLRLGFQGYKEFNAVFSAGMLCPLIFLIPFLGFIRRTVQAKGKTFILTLAMLVLIPLFMAGFCSASAGMLQRYMLDFYWYIILAGIFSALLFTEWLSEHGAQKAAYLGFVLCAFICLFFGGALCCGEPVMEMSWWQFNNPLLFARINYFFSFWL